ncbi:MAG: tetratricopeptide repeat protein [Planctomycetaceae bacterium]|nr:tetratricopeptide repeat protein [Planctomycetaceae bacterium]
MRTVNVRLTIILAVSVVGLSIGAHFLHRYQVRRNAYIFEEAAERSRKAADAAIQQRNVTATVRAYKDAIQNYSWYVRLVPDDVAAVEKLGLLMADMADLTKDVQAFGRAYSALERAVRQDPERQTARRRLVDMAMMARRFQDAKEHLKSYLLTQSPNDPQLWLLLGRCCVESNDYDLAADHFQKTIELDPQAIQAYSELASVLRGRLSREKDADHWMEKLVKSNPKSSRAHLLRGMYLLRNSDADESESQKIKDQALAESVLALNLAKEDRDTLRDALMLTSQCCLVKGDVKRAKEYVARGIKLYPGAIGMYTILADIESRSGNRQAAIDTLKSGLNATEQNPQLLWALGNLLIDINQRKEAQQVIEELQSREYSKPMIDYLLARIEYAKGHWLTARSEFERLRPMLASLSRGRDLVKQLDVWIGNCYGQAGNRDRQLQAYRRALNIDPFFGPARIGVTDVLMSTGNVDEAVHEYDQLAKAGRLKIGALIPMARMLILQNIRKPASQRNWQNVEAVLDRATKMLPSSEAGKIAILRADMLTAQDHLAEAEAVLEEARKKQPDQIEIWVSLTLLYERQENWQKAETLLADAEKTFGDTVPLRLAKAQYIVRRYGQKTDGRLRKLSENTSHFTSDERMQLQNGLLNSAMQADDATFAKDICRVIAKNEPDNVQIRYILFEQSLRSKDLKGMEESLAEIERVAGHGYFWNYGQAVRLSMEAERRKENPPLQETAEMLNQAMKYLSEARELRPTWARVPLLMAGIHEQQGKSDLALKEYLDAIEMGETNPNAIRRAVQILFQKQRYTEANDLLRQMENQQGSFSNDLSRASAEIALRQGDFNRALEMARKSAASQSKNPGEQLWLGQVLSIVGRRAKTEQNAAQAERLLNEAEQALLRAVELSPETAAPWIALVQFYQENDNSRSAEQTIEKAAKKIAPKQTPLALAQCYAIIKKFDLAEAKYEAAMAASPKDPFILRSVADFYYHNKKPAKAETLLQRLIERKVPASEADIAAARRQEAAILFERGGFQNLQKAQELIAANLAGENASTADYRVKANLDAADPRRSRREGAIDTWESMLKEQSASPEDRLELARMYLSSGAWLKANAQLRDLVASYPKEPRYLVTYISALLDHGETSNAEVYLQQLEGLHPNHIMTNWLRAEMFVANGQPQQALELLLKFINQPNAQPPEKDVRQRLIAERLEKLAGQMKKPADKAMRERFLQRSEMLLREYLSHQTDQEWLLAAFLARQHRIDESLDVADRIWASNVLDGIGRIMAILAQEPNLSTDQIDRLDRMMKSALPRFNRPVPLLMVQADVLIREERYAEAEKIYREVLEKNNQNAYALNNLAVLLALQGIRLDESLKCINRAIEIAGPLPTMLDSRTSVFTAMGETDKALADIAEALADAETPVRLFHQAVAYDRAGQPNAAATSMAKALDKGLIKTMLQPTEFLVFDKLKKQAR